MISQGTDGLLQNDMSKGVMIDKSIRDFVLLPITPLEHSKGSLEWIKSWAELPERVTIRGWKFWRYQTCTSEIMICKRDETKSVMEF